jgi:uncharacterized protein involved in exopolysaccharide biosynthesis
VPVSVAKPPNVPDERSAPRTVRNLALGAVIGVLLGISLAVARAGLDRSVLDPS